MIRSATLAMALALAAAPALASGPYYHAQPEATSAKPKVVTRDGIWSCSGGACSAPRGNSRAEIACAGLVREVGALRSFAAGGAAFGDEQLAKCNARAR
jgi:hypothetical protein